MNGKMISKSPVTMDSNLTLQLREFISGGSRTQIYKETFNLVSQIKRSLLSL